MTLKLSIIIPTFNSENTISNCLDSILNQSFKNLEIIIIDNLSVDGTKEIIRSYQLICNKILFISGHDRGIYDAMNKGIKIARGEWIYFIGCDDRLLDSNVLESILNMDHERSDVIYGNVISELFGGRYDGEFTFEKIIIRNICHQAIFFRRSVFTKIGVYNLKYTALSDWDHNLKWFLSRKITNRYLDLDIAEYGSSGYSSRYCDKIFMEEKNFNAIKYGFFSLSPSLLAYLSRMEYKNAINSRRFIKALLLKIIIYYSLVRIKLNKLL